MKLATKLRTDQFVSERGAPVPAKAMQKQPVPEQEPQPVEPEAEEAMEAKAETALRVDMPGHGLSVDSLVSVVGIIGTDSANGERRIQGTIIYPEGTGSVTPLGMSNRLVGGGPFGMQEGISGTAGLNNIGLLVTTWGEVIPGDTMSFYVNGRFGSVDKVSTLLSFHSDHS